MAMAITVMNESLLPIDQKIDNECKKFDKYFLSNPKVDCKVVSLDDCVHVKISLVSGRKNFSGEARGVHTDDCIHRAVQRLIRLMDTDGAVYLRR